MSMMSDKKLCTYTLSHGCPTDVIWDIAITIRYSEWSQLSNGYLGDVQVSTCVRSYGRNGNILKCHMEVKNIIVPVLHNENKLF